MHNNSLQTLVSARVTLSTALLLPPHKTSVYNIACYASTYKDPFLKRACVLLLFFLINHRLAKTNFNKKNEKRSSMRTCTVLMETRGPAYQSLRLGKICRSKRKGF